MTRFVSKPSRITLVELSIISRRGEDLGDVDYDLSRTRSYFWGIAIPGSQTWARGSNSFVTPGASCTSVLRACLSVKHVFRMFYANSSQLFCTPIGCGCMMICFTLLYSDSCTVHQFYTRYQLPMYIVLYCCTRIIPGIILYSYRKVYINQIPGLQQ